MVADGAKASTELSERPPEGRRLTLVATFPAGTPDPTTEAGTDPASDVPAGTSESTAGGGAGGLPDDRR